MQPREMLSEMSAKEREEQAQVWERALMGFEDRWVQDLRYSYTRTNFIPGSKLRIAKGQCKGREGDLPDAARARDELLAESSERQGPLL